MDGNTSKNQWQLSDQGAGGEHKEMMLNTDLCLAYSANQATNCFLSISPFDATPQSTADMENW